MKNDLDEEQGLARGKGFDAVPNERIAQALRSSVVALGGAFDSGEPAFLASTSKVELPMRDRLAWLLHCELGADFVVSREWRRADLAVPVEVTVIAQIEAKAVYAFDVQREASGDWPEDGYIGRLRRDAAKMASLAQSNRWLLSLITDVRGSIPQHLGTHVVKYAPGISKAIPIDGTELRDTTQQLWMAKLSETFGSGRTSVLRIDGGFIWSLDVSVDAFLTGPLA